MSTALVPQPQPAPLSIADTRLSVAQIQAQRKAILDLMQSAMKPGVDYGIIPGCDKPSLWKPGSEKILAMLHLAPKIRIEDLSTPDTIRYRVHVELVHIQTGLYFGEGVGEASSAESKYQWRGVVCQEEWDATPEDRRRLKWKRGKQGPYSVQQVRADMDDVANTVLKMGKKRAQIDVTLTATAASDIFAQDVEDIAEAGLDPSITDSGNAPQTTHQQPAELRRKDASPAPQSDADKRQAAAAQHGAKPITEDQAKRFWAVAMKRTNDYKLIMDYLRDVHGVKNKAQILMVRYDEAMKWAETGVAE